MRNDLSADRLQKFLAIVGAQNSKDELDLLFLVAGDDGGKRLA